MSFAESPYGFEDGEIVSYRRTSETAIVEYKFWNAQVWTLEFLGSIALHDDGAVGAIIGGVDESDSSELIARRIRAIYVNPPDSHPWRHFRFLDLDDRPILQVIAQSVRFSEANR